MHADTNKSCGKKQPNEKKEIGMIAGGSGITPMYQVFSFFLFLVFFSTNPERKTLNPKP